MRDACAAWDSRILIVSALILLDRNGTFEMPSKSRSVSGIQMLSTTLLAGIGKLGT